MKTAAILLLAGLAACASYPVGSESDQSRCAYEVNLALASQPDAAWAAYQRHGLMRQCMAQRGWQRP